MSTTVYRNHYDNHTDCESLEYALGGAAAVIAPQRIRQLVGSIDRGERLRLRSGEREVLGRVAWALPHHGVRTATAILALAYWLGLTQ